MSAIGQNAINQSYTHRSNRTLSLCPIAVVCDCENVQAGEIVVTPAGFVMDLLGVGLQHLANIYIDLLQRCASFPFLAISGRMPLLTSKRTRHHGKRGSYTGSRDIALHLLTCQNDMKCNEVGPCLT